MAKTLYLMRHAKSDWRIGMDDVDRPLNKRGLRDAPEMGRRLKARQAVPQLIICSPARRTRQTRELLGLEAETRYDERIYEASVEALLEIIQSLDERVESAMLIGHNPAIAWLINTLAAVELHQLPTCAVATLESGADRWEEFSSRPAALLDLDYPKRKPER